MRSGAVQDVLGPDVLEARVLRPGQDDAKGQFGSGQIPELPEFSQLATFICRSELATVVRTLDRTVAGPLPVPI